MEARPEVVTIITDVRVPADQFPLGRVLRAYPDVEIELERLIPTTEAVIPLFWITRGDEAAVEATLREDPLVEEVVRLTRADDRVLYSVNWSPDIDTLVRTLIDLRIDVLSAEGTNEAWTFRLQFRDRPTLKRFRRACQEHGLDLDLLEMFNPLMPPEKGPLSSEQKDVLATAYEHGYWDVPRRTSQEELASLIGVSESALSRRLREGVKSAVGTILFGSAGKPYE